MARPLTRRKEDGALYARPPNIEREIDLALSQDEDTLKRRLSVTIRTAADYLSSECLVHLIRRSLSRNDRSLADLCMPVLLMRCHANLLAQVPNGRLPNAAALREDILQEFGVMVATDSADEALNELDYFECRFNSAFRAFRIDRVRTETRHQNRFVPAPEKIDDDDLEEYEGTLRKVAEAFVPASQEDAAFLKVVRAAIDGLPEDERNALILCYALGFSEKSAATRCNCTDRTIRNRLSRAAQKLKALKEDM
jgi:RNA polymerase sigma factor (sigma-70 family)